MRSADPAPKAINFRTKAELWQYLHPGDTGISRSAEIISDEFYELPAPAYEEVVSEGSGLLNTAIQNGKAMCRASDYNPCRSPQWVDIRPEGMWLHAPRSCSTCGNIGLLPLHYCAECKKMRIDMCSECYQMGHEFCQRLGHDIIDTQRSQDIPALNGRKPTDMQSSKSAAEKSGADADSQQSMNKLLAFLTEEKVFMLEEINHARLNALTE